MITFDLCVCLQETQKVGEHGRLPSHLSTRHHCNRVAWACWQEGFSLTFNSTTYFVYFIIRAIGCWQLLSCYFHLAPLVVHLPWLSIKIPNRIQVWNQLASPYPFHFISHCLAPRKLHSSQAELFIHREPMHSCVRLCAGNSSLFLITEFKSSNGIWLAV